ncbi:hypothetical protein BOX15_Mlig013666g1 [Macrostomum lignano]|uniref:Alpha/beta hydrolase fold-3 domain-containing protein n=2 Tax=Macrostomum lignano TaxID=282301 RepID=A0A267ECM1_9PLAT|nr:hypothetical protein BOX15_Mlig013666g1 [Macrostomum lignano]
MELKKFLLIPILMAILAYLLYEPVPDYVQDWHSVAIKNCIGKLCHFIGSALSLTGLWEAPHVQLQRLADLALLTPALPANSSRLTVTEARFADSRALVFRPAGARAGGPGLVWIHGGGWVFGSPDASAGFVTRLAMRINITAVAIEYRRAPEHPFPAAFDDCLAAVRSILANASSVLGVNPHRIMLGGDSAGGQLAASVTQALAKAEDQLTPRLQLLVYPITQLANFRTQSHRESYRSPLLEGSQVARSASMYLTGSIRHWRSVIGNGHASKSVRAVYTERLGESMPPESSHADATLAAKLEKLLIDPRVSPLLTPSIDPLRLPPAYIVACQHDPLRSDAHLYSQRLEKSGVRVYYKYYPCYHGCLTEDKDAKRIVDDMAVFFNSNAML